MDVSKLSPEQIKAALSFPLLNGYMTGVLAVGIAIGWLLRKWRFEQLLQGIKATESENASKLATLKAEIDEVKSTHRSNLEHFHRENLRRDKEMADLMYKLDVAQRALERRKLASIGPFHLTVGRKTNDSKPIELPVLPVALTSAFQSRELLSPTVVGNEESQLSVSEESVSELTRPRSSLQ